MYDTYEFGRYPQRGPEADPIRWLVLERCPDRLLLLSRDCLAAERYHFSQQSVCWQNCNLRAWLHQIFVPSAFAEEELKRILPPADAGMQTLPQEDLVFILNQEEVERYFPSPQERIGRAAVRADEKRRQYGFIHDDDRCSWWVRTDGVVNPRQTSVNRDGWLLVNRYFNDDAGTLVRPALWLRTAWPGERRP